MECESNNVDPLRACWPGVSFDTPEAVLEAAKQLHAAGYRRCEAYTPFAVQGLAEALGFRKTGVPLIVLAGGLVGGLGGYFMLWYANVISYPITRRQAAHSWPAFIPITFELTVLGASLLARWSDAGPERAAFALSPDVPAPHFELATQTHFFLCIEADDPSFDSERTRQFLEGLNGLAVVEVPWSTRDSRNRTAGCAHRRLLPPAGPATSISPVCSCSRWWSSSRAPPRHSW